MAGINHAVQAVQAIKVGFENDDAESSMRGLSKFLESAAPSFFIQSPPTEAAKNDRTIVVRNRRAVNALTRGPMSPASGTPVEPEADVTMDDLESEIKSLSKTVHKPRGRKKVGASFSIDWKTFIIETVTRFLDMWKQAKDTQKEPEDTGESQDNG